MDSKNDSHKNTTKDSDMLKSTNGIASGLIAASLMGLILLQCSPEKPKRPTPIAAPNPQNLEKPEPNRNPQSENTETNPTTPPNTNEAPAPAPGTNETTVPAGSLGIVAKEATILVGLEGGMKCEFAKNTKLILTHRPVTLPNEELVRVTFEKVPGCEQTQGLIFKEQFSKI
jgi:hypothetical protein